MKRSTSSDLSSFDEADEESDYEDQSQDEIDDTKPQHFPKRMHRQVVAVEMGLDPVHAERKCFRCFVAGADCLLPFESDQIDIKCNKCQAEDKPYCNVNDRQAIVKQSNGSPEINLYCMYYEALRKKHEGEDPVSTDFSLGAMDMQIIKADSNMFELYKAVSAKFAAKTSKDARRRTAYLQVQPSASYTPPEKPSAPIVRTQVDVGIGKLNKDPCFFCSSKGYECREASQEQLKKDSRNREKCHACISRSSGRCNANQAQPKFGSNEKGVLMQRYYDKLIELLNKDNTGPWRPPETDFTIETLDLDRLNQFGLHRRYAYVTRGDAKAKSSAKSTRAEEDRVEDDFKENTQPKHHERRRKRKNNKANEEGSTRESRARRRRDKSQNSKATSTNETFVETRQALLQRLAASPVNVSTPVHSRSPHQDDSSHREKSYASGLDEADAGYKLREKSCRLSPVARSPSAILSRRSSLFEPQPSSSSEDVPLAVERERAKGRTRETAIEIDSSDEEEVTNPVPTSYSNPLEVCVKQEQSEDELEQPPSAFGPTKQTSDYDSQQREGERHSESPRRSPSPIKQVSRGGLDPEEIQKTECDRKAFHRAYEACVKHKLALKRREEAELQLASADKDQQRLLGTQLHLDSSQDAESSGYRNWRKAEEKYKKLEKELGPIRRQEEDAQRLMYSYMGDISREKATQIREKVDNEFLQERQEHRGPS